MKPVFKPLTSVLLAAGMLMPLLTQTSLAAAFDSETDPAKKGLAISVAAKESDKGWESMEGEMSMVLRNRQGQESIRAVRMKSLEVEGDGDKSLSVFDEPRDVKGTAFLSFSHPVGDDDQWIFLPALKKVKRISSRNKSGPFMGSEFAYEDLSSFEVEKYTYKYLQDEACG
ncbi:MAG: outer membrane lipoprotein-sorting protein, partial [Oceanobacter sp.]